MGDIEMSEWLGWDDCAPDIGLGVLVDVVDLDVFEEGSVKLVVC